MTEIITQILSNQYVQILLSAIQFVGWGGIATFIVTIVSWRRKLKKRLDDETLKKNDLDGLAEKLAAANAEVGKLADELKREHEYNALTNDAVVLQVLSSRRIDGKTKLAIAKQAQTLADNEVVRKAAEAAIAAIPEDTVTTEDDDDETKNSEYAANTDELLKQLTAGGGGL